MKFAILLMALQATVLFGGETVNVAATRIIRVSDVNREQVAGAKIICEGTGYIAYTNSQGECFIPAHILKQSKSVKVESVSYRSIQIESFEIKSEIVLDFR